MDSTVKTRPTHYETLGLRSDASEEQIAEAFARELLRPRAFGGLAEVSLAHAVLRDRAKRDAYDAAMGLKAEPQAEAEAAPSNVAAASWEETPYFFRATPHLAEPVAVDPVPPPATPTTPAPFIAAPGAEMAEREPPSEGPRPQQPTLKANPEYLIAVDRALGRTGGVTLPDAEPRPIAWKRTVGIVGGTILAVGLIGAWAGLEAGSDAEAQSPERAVTVALPKAKAPAPTVATAPTPPAWLEEQPKRAAAPRRAARAAAPRQHGIEEQAQSEIAQVAVEPAAVDPLAPQPAAASMPLSNAVIARTIKRIGYACGTVTATTEGDAPGVYTVTCASGDSYQAKPVRGRYHFRRLGSR